MSRRPLGAALLVVAGVTAAVGTFLPLFWEGNEVAGIRLGFAMTSWEVTGVGGTTEADLALFRTPQYGVPIVIAAVLLAVASALVFLPETQRLAGRYTAIVGTGLLAGAVWAVVMAVVAAVGNARDSDFPGYTTEAGSGVGVLIGAVLVAVAGVVLVHGGRGGAEPRPEGPVVYRVDDSADDGVDDDTDTPPFGIPVQSIEIAQIPESEYGRRSDDGPGGSS
ncbi:hypothetical protein [Saccharothrix deserti]|uniref:hypothetical protein n=1 Tax=Saccharothrix deserti TaxID=2593674 RepID=UPI00131CEEE7|nr:hypothetical protein [Saccharothrix deserti]